MLMWRILTDTGFKPQALVLRAAHEAYEHDPAILQEALDAHPQFAVPAWSQAQACVWPIGSGVKLHIRRDQLKPLPVYLANSPGDIEIGLAAGCKQLALPALFAPPAPRPSNTAMYSLVLQTLGAIAEEARPEAIEKTVRADPALWVRLLRYFNSPAVGPAREVTNLRQGLSLVGYRGLSRWFALSLVTAQIDLPGPLRCAAFRSLYRAHFNEALANSSSVHRGVANQAFMLGLLTELPALTGLPIQQLVTQLKLPATLLTILSSTPEQCLTRADPLGVMHALSLATESTRDEMQWVRLMQEARTILRLEAAEQFIAERQALSSLGLGALGMAWDAMFPTL